MTESCFNNQVIRRQWPIEDMVSQNTLNNQIIFQMIYLFVVLYLWFTRYIGGNKSRAPNFFIQHDKVETSKLRRYLETCSRALEQFLQRQTFSNDSIIFLLCMPLDRLVRGRASVREHAQ